MQVAVAADEPASRFGDGLGLHLGLPAVVADDLRIGRLDVHRAAV
jgi:hypothetical protein